MSENGPVALIIPLEMQTRYSCASEYIGRIQTYLGLNIPFFSSEAILKTGSVQFTGTSLMQLGDLAMVSDDCTIFDCSHNQRNIHA